QQFGAMELIRYWRVVRRWAWIIIVCPLVGALAAGLISLQLPNVYEAQVLLYVQTPQVFTPTPGTVYTSSELLKSYAVIITSREQLQKVISDENLGTDPKSLRKRITATQEPGTLILNVAVRDTDPDRAERTANTLVNNFAAYVNAF